MLERGLGLCETWTILDWSITIESALGVALALADRGGEAMALQRRAEAEEPQAPQGFPAARILRRGETCWLAGALDEARAEAERGLALARDNGERGAEVRALRLLGDIAAAGAGPAAEAEPRYRSALALAEEIGMRPQAARCHLGLAVLDGRAGRLRSEHGATALAMFTDMAMSHWAARTRRALAPGG